MKKTKVIATIGPASKDIEILKNLMLSGMDVARINLRYADKEFCEDIVNKIKNLNKELKTNTAILFDLEGPDITVGHFSGGSAYLNKGDKIRVYMDEVLGDSTKFSISYPNLINEIKVNNVLKINDGLIELKIIDKEINYLLCEVINGGFIEDGKGVNVGIHLNIPFLRTKDIEDIKLANELNIDYLALSKVSSYEDVLSVNDMLINLGNDHIAIISKIENEHALDEVDEIIKNSEGIIVARGDLGVELPMERLPKIQKMIINKCHIAGKISVVATELLSSMENVTRPTRAEVADIANAVLEGTDAVMLSGETTIGNYPVQSLEIMSKIIEETEVDQNYYEFLDTTMRTEKQDITGSVAYSAVECAIRLKCKAIVTPTISGYTARKISRFRPNCPIVAITPDINVVKNLKLYYGIYPVLESDINSFDKIMKISKEKAKNILKLEEKDKIIITGGYPFKEVKHTNFMKIEEV
mgnify:FL=1